MGFLYTSGTKSAKLKILQETFEPDSKTIYKDTFYYLLRHIVRLGGEIMPSLYYDIEFN